MIAASREMSDEPENNLPLQVFGKCGYPFNILNKRAMPNIWISTLFYCNNTNFSLNL